MKTEEDFDHLDVGPSSSAMIAQVPAPTTSSRLNLPMAEPTTPIEVDDVASDVSGADDDDHSIHDLPDDVYNFEKENGRTYHGYRRGSYLFPNDATETERLEFQYTMLKHCFSQLNFFAPITDPQRILDIGTGTGTWAIDVADQFPHAEIQATDLSPIQPLTVPRNVQFFIDDAAEEDWAVPPQYFDFIHTRVMLGSFEDFRSIIQRSLFYLKPGGYMESQEVMSTPYCDDGTMSPEWPFLEWMQTLDAAAMEASRPLRIANKLKRWYEAAGFVDVQEKVFKLPINPWPQDKHLKTLGRMHENNLLAGLGGLSMGHFSRVLGWSKNEIEVYLVNVRKSISDRSVHAYHRVFAVWGRKPFEHELRAREEDERVKGKEGY